MYNYSLPRMAFAPGPAMATPIRSLSTCDFAKPSYLPHDDRQLDLSAGHTIRNYSSHNKQLQLVPDLRRRAFDQTVSLESHPVRSDVWLSTEHTHARLLAARHAMPRHASLYVTPGTSLAALRALRTKQSYHPLRFACLP
jgi:hypothetical protein